MERVMKKIITVSLALIFLFTLPLSAQFKLSLEPALGMNFNIHSGSDLPESGNGFGIMVGGYAHMMFSKNLGMIAGLAFYDNRSGSYTSTQTIQQGVNADYDVSSSMAYFQIESLFKVLLPSSGLYFVAGPVLGFNVESEAEATVKITTPGYQFQTGGTTTTNKSTIKDVLVRFELKAGAGYEIPLSKSMDLVPQLTFGYGLTNVVKDVKWHIMTFQLNCGVKFDL
jgi:hypothetical protein